MSQHLAFRRLRRPRWIALALAAVCMASGLRLSAQDRNLDPDIAPNTRQPSQQFERDSAPNSGVGRVGLSRQDGDEGNAPSTRVARAALPHPDLRRDPEDPRLDRLLQAWSDHTQQIRNLAGKHYRSTRDYQWNVETLAEGKFFVEMPDKGRIDVSTYTRSNPKAGDKKTYTAPDGKQVEMTIKLDEKREKWICDGKLVRVIDDGRKTVEEVPIPPNQQGVNMVDGPLPFLLGMPPEKAKARYRFKLLGLVGEDRIWIEVKPRLAMDAAEWVRAHVLLNLKDYLPERVSLFNPAGTTETVYIFFDIEMNKRGLFQKIFSGDPFKPNVWNYHREVHAPPTGDPNDLRPRGPSMPLVVGASSDRALEIKKQLMARGFDVEFQKGPTAPTPDQVFHIESQQPEANTPLKPGQKIVLRWYDKIRTVNQQLQQ